MPPRKKELPRLDPFPPGLSKRSATELEIVRWVARSIQDRNVKPKDCPAPFAWTLLLQCREDADFTRWFVEKLWSKLIPSRTQLETKDTKELDGKVTMDLISKIQAMGESAREVARPVAVKAPEPKPIPSAFETFDPKEEE